MEAIKIKRKVEDAFKEVDSTEFLNLKVQDKKQQIELEFHRRKIQNPRVEKDTWINEQINSINLQTTNHEEIMAIGIFLLALDQIK